MKLMNLLITGSRNYGSLHQIEPVLAWLMRSIAFERLYVGDAWGVDAEAAKAWEN